MISITDLKDLSHDAKDSLIAMLDYCLRHGVGLGMDEGYSSGDDKHSYRVEIEELLAVLLEELD